MIYIAFTKDDVIQFLSIATSSDVILTYSELIDNSTNIKIFDVNNIHVDWSTHVSYIRELFKESNILINEDIKCYANNFFECTIKIIIQYIESIKVNLYSHKNITFAKKVLGNCSPNYYLSEHESQGQILYNRRLAIQSSIESYLKKADVNVSYKGFCINYQIFNNIVRDFAVFTKRLFDNVRQNGIFEIPLNINNEFSTFIILRTHSQFIAIKPLLEKSKMSIGILCANSYNQKDLYKILEHWSTNYNNIDVFELPKVGFKFVFLIYFNIFKKIFFTFDILYDHSHFYINLNQSFREILIMSADLKIYEFRLKSFLPNADKKNVFLTCEQKSPQAYVEAKVARNKGFKTIQLMACDQDSNDLPYPVNADFFLTDTFKRFQLFTSHWSSNTNRVKYIGSSRLVNNKGFDLSSDKKYDFDVCYFAHVSEVEHNIKIIHLLKSIKSKMKDFSFCVKLHPRDEGNWFNTEFSNSCILFNSTDITNDVLFNNFKVGLSNPSAVVLEMLCQFKPFIFIDILKIDENVDYVSCDELYLGYINSLPQLSSLLLSNVCLMNELKLLHSRVFGRNPKQLSLCDVHQLF